MQKIICPFCNRHIIPDKTQQRENSYILDKYQCPKCFMFIKSEMNWFHQGRRLKHIKEILGK